MEAANEANMVLQLPKFNFNGKNKQEFLRKWPQVARHFKIEEVISGEYVRPGGDDMEGQAAWDQTNQLALDKLRYYVSESVNSIVWKGKRDITAKQFYDRMNALMLRTSVRNSVNMEGKLTACDQ